MKINKSINKRLVVLESALRPTYEPFVIYFTIVAPRDSSVEGYFCSSDPRIKIIREKGFAMIIGHPRKKLCNYFDRCDGERIEDFVHKVEKNLIV